MTEDTRAATFTCVTGLDHGRVFPIAFDDNVIGRADDAAIRIRDRAVSRHHVRVVHEERKYVLKLVVSSMNGVYVNGLLLKKDTVLKTGDVVEVGQTILRFDASERAPEERTVVVGPVPVPQVAELAAQLEEAPRVAVVPVRAKRITLEHWLMSAGLALTLLGLVAAALML